MKNDYYFGIMGWRVSYWDMNIIMFINFLRSELFCLNKTYEK